MGEEKEEKEWEGEEEERKSQRNREKKRKRKREKKRNRERETERKVHGYTNEFLSTQKTFLEIADDFLKFIENKKIIIHNAPFDLSFLDYELKLINKKSLDRKNIIDTLEIARAKYPGSQNSLDALCKRFNIDNSKRKKHNALIDCQLLREVYVNLIDQKEPKLNLKNVEITNLKFENNFTTKKNMSRKVIKPDEKELKLHQNYLKSQLQKNFF